jgi:hypothetical protein
MCDYITAILPAQADRIGLSPIVKRYHLDFSPISNAYVAEQLRAGETYHRATRHRCDCGTCLGSLTWTSEPRGESHRWLVRKVRKLQSKGWSRAKIDRWLAQRDANTRRRKSELHAVEQRVTEESVFHVERWLAILREMIQSGKTPSVGLLVHWYSRSLESEKVEIKKRCVTRLSEADSELMLHMEHDVLYEFTT